MFSTDHSPPVSHKIAACVSIRTPVRRFRDLTTHQVASSPRLGTVRLDAQECRSRLRRAGHGILATTLPDGRPHAVPVCFTLESNLIAVPHDHVKPKAEGRLQRERNLEVDGRGALLIE